VADDVVGGAVDDHAEGVAAGAAAGGVGAEVVAVEDVAGAEAEVNAGTAEAVDGQAADGAVAGRHHQAVGARAGGGPVEVDEGGGGEAGLGGAVEVHGVADGRQGALRGDAVDAGAGDGEADGVGLAGAVVGVEDGLAQRAGAAVEDVADRQHGGG
jgi:hypothetical protein